MCRLTEVSNGGRAWPSRRFLPLYIVVIDGKYVNRLCLYICMSCSKRRNNDGNCYYASAPCICTDCFCRNRYPSTGSNASRRSNLYKYTVTYQIPGSKNALECALECKDMLLRRCEGFTPVMGVCRSHCHGGDRPPAIFRFYWAFAAHFFFAL